MDTYQEITIRLPHQNIAAKVWGDPSHLPVLALHGWLDNAASFDRIAPLLSNIYLIAIDLPGHGLSDHQPKGTHIHLIDYLIEIVLIADALKLEQYVLLGHSLGAAIASFIAGTTPDKILGVALIDALGFMSSPSEHAPSQVHAYLEEITRYKPTRGVQYENPEEAILARLAAGHVGRTAAEILVHRGLKQLENGKWTWRTDPRLLMPLSMLFTEEQTLAFLKNIKAPVLIIRPKEGYPFPPDMVENRLNAVEKLAIFETPGKHHVHLDSPEVIVDILTNFFQDLKY